MVTGERSETAGRLFKVLLGIATLAAASATVWQVWFQGEREGEGTHAGGGVVAPDVRTPAESRVAVEKLTGRWMDAWRSVDADRFVEHVSEPFFFDHHILLTKAEVRAKFLDLASEKGESWKRLQISRIKVNSARELEAQGKDLTGDRIFSSMNLTLDDWAATVYVRTPERSGEEAMLLFVRELGDEFEIVGMWD